MVTKPVLLPLTKEHYSDFDQLDHPIGFPDWLSSELQYSKIRGLTYL